FCMITTITFLIGTLPPVGPPGVGVGEGDAPTPPQPIVKARKGRLKKNRKTRLKVLAPQVVGDFSLHSSWPANLQFFHQMLTPDGLRPADRFSSQALLPAFNYEMRFFSASCCCNNFPGMAAEKIRIVPPAPYALILAPDFSLTNS